MSQVIQSSETELLLPKTETQKKRFPFHVLFILGNEFCERYSFYGMRTILVLYLTYYIKWDEDTSTAVFHAFNVLCYLFPLFGGILADGWWGKYRTIFWLSVVYAIGMVLNTLGAINTLGSRTTHIGLSATGLIVIAIGTGGIKPCVAAFGGDQFDADQEVYLLQFFSLFYFAINSGSLISTFVSPQIREHVDCFGTACYPLAFGIPAILMIVSLCLFLAGTRFYRINPPTGDIFTKVSKTIWVAVKNRWKTPSSERTKDHWLEYARNDENASLIRDIKYALNVLVIFIPLPLFWTLFDQQGSRWTLQAVRMNGYVGSAKIPPDQMQSCNPILIILLIPFTETILYPLLRKFNIKFRPLQRMTVGMLLAGLSFIVAALIHMKIDVTLTDIPQLTSESSLRVINSANCPVLINSTIYPEWILKNQNQNFASGLLLGVGQQSNTASNFTKPATYNLTFGCNNSMQTQTISITLKPLIAHDLYISQFNKTSLKYLFSNHSTKKSDDGNALVSFVNTMNENIVLNGEELVTLNKKNNLFISSNNKSEIFKVDRGERGTLDFVIKTRHHNTSANVSVGTGGIYSLVVRRDYTSDEYIIVVDNYTDVSPNTVNIFWMIPQYFLITFGEIFLSITGLSFAYSQAPPSMKSLLQSFWLLTVSIGNIIVLIVAEARLIHSQTNEYFLFAGLIGIATILFMILAYRYKYVDEKEFYQDEAEVANSNNEK